MPEELSPFKLLVSILIAVVAGCAITPPEPLLSSGADRVALVPAHFEPQINFNAYALGKSAAAGKKAAEGAGEAGTEAAIRLSPLLVIPPLYAASVIATSLVGATVGAGMGAILGLSEEDARTISTAVESAFASLKVQESIAKRLWETASQSAVTLQRAAGVGNLAPRSPTEQPDYSAVLGALFDAVLETSMMEVRFDATKDEVAMEMTLRVRSVEPTKTVLAQFTYSSPRRPVSDWADKGGARILEELEAGYQHLAEQVSQRLLAAPRTKQNRATDSPAQ
jgi:hypothetical protein